MRFLLISILLGLLWSCSTSNETTATEKTETEKSVSPYLLERKNTSSIRIYHDSIHGRVVETLNTRYYRHDALIGDIGDRFVVEEKQLTRTYDAQGCKEGALEMKIWRMERDTIRLMNELADQSVKNEFILPGHHILKTKVSDCSDAIPVYHLYSLSNSTPLLTYHDDFSLLKLPQTSTVRLTGFHPFAGTEPALRKKDNRDFAGYLMYSSDRKRIHLAAVSCNDSTLLRKVRRHPPKTFYIAERAGNVIRMNDMDLYPDKGEDFYTVPTNFSIELIFTELEGIDPIQIPVVDDELQVEAAKVPDGFEIELIQ